MKTTSAIDRAIRAAALFAIIATAATANAQTTGPVRSVPGAPPGTAGGTPVVIPNTNPDVTTTSPSQLPNGIVPGTPLQPLPNGDNMRRVAPTTSGAANPPPALVPWTVTLIPRNLPFRDGQCSPISVELLDASGKEVPRAPNGWRVSIADFDMNVSASGAAVVGQYSGASIWAACACPNVAPGTVATITATYPSRTISPASRVPGVAFESSIVLPVAYAAPGTGNPAPCASLPPTTTVAMSPPPGTSGPGSPAAMVSGTQIPATVTVAAQPASQPASQPAAPLQAMPTQQVAGGSEMTREYFAPTGVVVTGTPAEAHVTWQLASRALGYEVKRWNANDPGCCRVGSPVIGANTNSWTDVVQSTAPWVYRVTATFPDGSKHYTDATYTYPKPQAPSGFSARQTGPGTVTLSWQPVPNASYYLVGGPPGNTAIRVDGTSVVRSGVPAGNHSWMVATTYESSAGPRQGSAFVNTSLVITAPTSSPVGSVTSGTTVPPAAVSGRYRVVATGFRVLHETKDDVLSRDGRFDEVYGAFVMLHYNRSSSQILDRDLRRTKVIGDVWQHPGRLQGGTGSDAGGFRGGDVFPAVADPSKLYGATPTRETFPFLIWDGTLTDAQDAVIILPTIWEYDGNSDGYEKWFGNELAESSRIWSDVGIQAAVSGGDIGLTTPPASVETAFGPTFSASSVFEMVFTGPGVITLWGVGSYDRPIGSGKTLYGAPVLPRRAIVVTRENIETALRKQVAALAGSTLPSGVLAAMPPDAASALPNGGLPFGTIAVPLFDAPSDDLQGRYILYVQVERIP